MELIYNIFVFIIGLCFGSFLNVVAYRLPLKIDYINGHSICPTCKKRLKPQHLIPLLSYIFQKGKCAYCHEPIAIRYPLMELFTGIIYLLTYLVFQNSLLTLINLAFISLLIVIALIDFDTMDIYDSMHIIILIIGVIKIFCLKENLINNLIGLIAISLPLLIIYYMTKGGIGGGDVKLMAASGFFLGYPLIILAFIIGTFLATFYALYLLIKKISKWKDQIPFGPFLCGGIIVSLLYGNNIINLYLSLF